MPVEIANCAAKPLMASLVDPPIEIARTTPSTLSLTTAADPCQADLDGDGTVAASDLAMPLGSWGDCADCSADLNGDGTVDAADLAQLLGSWGPCS